MKFELGKTYKMRDGQSATLVHIFGEEKKSKFKLLWVSDGINFTTMLSGHFWLSMEASPNDIMPPKQSGTVYLNVYSDDTYGWHKSLEAANLHSAADRIACIEVQWEEGQGL